MRVRSEAGRDTLLRRIEESGLALLFADILDGCPFVVDEKGRLWVDAEG